MSGLKLLGSATSPYVRRIRLLLADTPYEFVDWDIYDADRGQLQRRNPALKIPLLEDDDGRVVYDSRVISRYLGAKWGQPALSWDDENRLTLIDAANDSGVTLLLSQRSGIDTSAERMFYKLQHERIASSMRALSGMADAGQFGGWHYPAICLYCLVDWMAFRQVFDFADCAALLAFRDAHGDQPMVAATDPRRA